MSRDLFDLVAQLAGDYRDRVAAMPVAMSHTADELLAHVRAELPDDGESPEEALRALVAAVEPGLTHTSKVASL